MKTILLLASVVALAACAQTRVVQSPSTAPIKGDITHIQKQIESAQSLNQRVHDKDVIIDMWNQTHHQ